MRGRQAFVQERTALLDQLGDAKATNTPIREDRLWEPKHALARA